MMRRGLLLLLRTMLLLWRPLDFAIEVPSVLSSLGMRGAPGIVELLFHGAIAALAVAAVRALSRATPENLPLVRAALVASTVASVQSLYWSALPHQTMPGDKLPLAILSVVVSVAWLAYLRRFRERES